MPRKKATTLTNAELRIMEVIWARGSATVAQVVEALKGKDAYSTILTLYLAYLGFAGGLTGILLWPVVALHVVLTILLGRASLATKAR